MLTMGRMQTRTESLAPVSGWLAPMGSWEAMARWNAMAFEWMTEGWQQWLQLVTAWPALENPAAAANEVAQLEMAAATDIAEASQADAAARSVDPAQAGTQKARNARALASMGSDRGKGRSAREARATASAPKRAAASKRAARTRSSRA
jgi:hypothetical protein